MLRIKISDVGPDGMDIDLTIPTTILDPVDEKFLHFTEPFQLKAELRKAIDKVVITGILTSSYSGDCGRCLESVEGKWSRDFSFVVDADRTTEFIDITAPLQEEVLLFLPEKLVCKEECRGLCPSCGQNLNARECGCDRSDFQSHAEVKEETYKPFKNLRLKS